MTVRVAYILALLGMLASLVCSPPAYAERVVRVATEQNPPLSYLDEQQHGAGLLIDLLEYTAKRESWRIEYVGCVWDRCLEQLRRGEVDLLATVAYTNERAQQFDFNQSNVVANWGVLYGPRDHRIASFLDLSGRKIAVVKGDTHQKTLRSMLEQFGVTAIYVETANFGDVFKAVEDNEVDAGVVGRFYALKHEDRYKIKATPLVFNPIEVRFAAPKGNNADLLQTIDARLNELKSVPGSYYYQTLDRWLGELGRDEMPRWLWWLLWCGGALMAISVPTVLILRCQVRNRTLRLEHEQLQRVQAQQALKTSEDKLRSIISTTGEGFWMIDPDTRQTIDVNDALCRMLGYSRTEMLGKTPLDFADEANQAVFRHQGGDAKTSSYRSYEVSLLRRDGSELATQFNASTLWDATTSSAISFAFVTDISDRKRAEIVLQESERKYRELVENANSIILRMTSAGIVTFFNEFAERFFGFGKDEIVGRNVVGTIVPESDRAGRSLAGMARDIGEQPEHYLASENEHVCKDGRRVWVSWTNRVVADAQGRVTEILCVGQDITLRRAYEEQLVFHANYDQLTELPNRTLLLDRLTQAMAVEDRVKHMMALMLLDLDNFKMTNDTLGHVVGDQLLIAVARRLLSVVRATDTVARLGGDEFAVLTLDLLDTQEAARFADRLLEAFLLPFEIDGRELFVTASVGIALHPGDGNTAEELIQHADVAMYHAKDLGKNNFQFFTDEINSRVHERMMMETMLRRALERGEYVLHYQPQIAMPEGRVAGLEALLRWRPEGERVIGPSVFIPVLEETGLIVPVGEWVLRTACAQFKTWRDQGLPPFCLSVNISARQFQEPDLADTILAILRETGFDPQYLRLELTESLLMGDVEQIASKLQGLSDLGISLSIDDFGTGYSSLSYLQQLPISELKIDRSFVRNLPHSSNDAAIVNTIIGMARSLNMNVVAEGVERDEQLEFLARQSCQEIQGFFFSRPLPAEAIGSLLRSGELLTTLQAVHSRT